MSFSWAKFFVLTALMIYFVFGFSHLSQFISSDEHFWLPNSGTERIEDYWKAIEKGNWRDTRINDKPGVTLAYIPGLVNFVESTKGQVKTDGKAKIFNPSKTQEINFIYRAPILIFNGLFVALFFFWIVKKITEDEWIAAWSAILILLSPVLLGISQIVNPDSLFWIFSVSALLTFYHYLQSENKKFALLTTLFFGLTMTTKYVGIILIPFFLFMMLAYYLFTFSGWKDRAKEQSRTILRNSLFYWLVIFGGLAIFAVLMPALIVKPKFFYQGTIGFPGMAPVFWAAMIANLLLTLDAHFWQGNVLSLVLGKLQFLKKWLPMAVYLLLAATFVLVLINWLSRNSLIDLSAIPYDLKRNDLFAQISFPSRFIMEAVPMVFALVPFTLFLLLFLWIESIFRKNKHSLLTFLFSYFIIIFYLAVIKQGLLLTVRYSIMLYPLVLIMVAIALRQMFSPRLQNITKRDFPRAIASLLLAALLIFQGLSLYFQSLTKTEQDMIYVSYHRLNEYLFAAGILLAIYALYRFIYLVINSEKFRNLSKAYISLIILILSIIPLWLSKPFYFNYTNELLPKRYIISAAWGYGGYEAAQYVNSLPDAKNLTVWADMYGFCEFFVGRCIRSQKLNTDKYKIDYYYITPKGSIVMNFPHPMESEPAWEMYIDGRHDNHIKLFKAIPPDQAGTDNGADTADDDTDGETS